MSYLRTIVYYIFFGISLLFWCIYCLLIAKFVKKDTIYWICLAWVGTVMKAASIILGIKIVQHGYDNLPKPGEPAVVILIKHQSQFETFLVPSLFKNKFAYVFKQELFRVPLLGWALKQVDMIPIDRSKRSSAFQKILAEGKQRLEKGTWVAMFPEGTRIPRGQAGKYKIGGAALAVHAKVPVVPVAVTSARCWINNPLCKLPGTVDVSFGPQISSTDKTAEQVLEQASSWIEAEMRRLDPQAYQ